MEHESAVAAIRDAESVVITTHLNPDGDGIGAGLALLIACDRLGKRARFLCPSRVASLYSFLPGAERIEPVDDDALAAAGEPCDLVVSCDCGDLERLGAVARWPRRRLLNVDHHASNDRFGDLNLVDVAAESTGVVVRSLLDGLGVGLDEAIATCLYTTIVFDTGRFMHPNTSAHTFRFAADLLDAGIDAAAINRKLTYTLTPRDLELQALAIRRLRVDDGDPRLAGIAISKEDIAEVGEPEDWGDLVEIPRSLVGVEVAYLMRELPAGDGGTVVRCSLRSNPPYRVGPVAEAFDGGGHLQAAGCTVEGALAEVRGGVLAKLRDALRRAGDAA